MPIFAQYQPGGGIGSLEEELQLAREKSEIQIQTTSGGTLQVGFFTDPINANTGNPTQLKVSFINKQTSQIQPHIDYKISILQGGNVVFGIPITHTAEGAVSIPFTFQTAGTYQIIVDVEGILFQPIPPETATFTINVVGSSTQPMDSTFVTVTSSTSIISSGGQVTVTATVTDPTNFQNIPTGAVTWSDENVGGTFSQSSCILSENTCLVTYTAPYNVQNSITITANYVGDSTHNSSYSTYLLSSGPQSQTGAITVTTDKSSYEQGDSIVVSGTVSQVDSINPQTPVIIQTYDGNHEFIREDRVIPAYDGQYSVTLNPNALWQNTGVYTLKVKYDIPSTFSQTTFYFNSGISPSPAPISTQSISNEIDMVPGAGSSATAACVATNTCFSPNPMNIPPGTTVIWRNTDTVSHYVTSGHSYDNRTGTIFDSGNLIKPQGTYQFTFANPGTIQLLLYCPSMDDGQVNVGVASGITPIASNPQTAPTITVTTDGLSYNFGDTITISGSTMNYIDQPVTLIIKSPAGNIVSLAQVPLGSDRTYSTSIDANTPLWQASGTYTVVVQFGSNANMAQTTFQFTGQPSYQQYQYPQFQPNSPNEIDMVPGAGSSASAACVAAHNCFSPNSLYIAPGTTVTWRNTDAVSHYVTSGRSTDATTGTVFDSGNLIKPQGTYQFTFANPGTYNYFCTVHPWMTGQVIVGQSDMPMPTQSGSVFIPTQQDIQSISEAEQSQTIAAEVNVGAGQSTTRSIDNNVSVQTMQNSADSLNVNVSAPSQTGPKVIAFNLNTRTINVANLNNLGVMYDGKLIPPAANVDDVLHAKSTDNPSFAIIVTQSGVQILVLVPHFSTHTITIMNMSQIMTSTVPEFPFAAIVLIIATLSIVVVSRMRHSL